MINTILVIIGVIAVLGATYYIVWKKGLINDRDKDLVPDEVEDAVEDVKKVAKEVKRRGKNVKKELKDVVEAAKEVGNQLGDVGAAVKGKKRQGRKKKK
jgi:F0F1-type ATP synthase membrane subunit b/b'